MKEATSCQQQRAETWPLLGGKNYGKNWTGWWLLPSPRLPLQASLYCVAAVTELGII